MTGTPEDHVLTASPGGGADGGVVTALADPVRDPLGLLLKERTPLAFGVDLRAFGLWPNWRFPRVLGGGVWTWAFGWFFRWASSRRAGRSRRSTDGRCRAFRDWGLTGNRRSGRCWDTSRFLRTSPHNAKRRAQALQQHLVALALDALGHLPGPRVGQGGQAFYSSPSLPFEADGGVVGGADRLGETSSQLGASGQS